MFLPRFISLWAAIAVLTTPSASAFTYRCLWSILHDAYTNFTGGSTKISEAKEVLLPYEKAENPRFETIVFNGLDTKNQGDCHVERVDEQSEPALEENEGVLDQPTKITEHDASKARKPSNSAFFCRTDSIVAVCYVLAAVAAFAMYRTVSREQEEYTKLRNHCGKVLKAVENSLKELKISQEQAKVHRHNKEKERFHSREEISSYIYQIVEEIKADGSVDQSSKDSLTEEFLEEIIDTTTLQTSVNQGYRHIDAGILLHLAKVNADVLKTESENAGDILCSIEISTSLKIENLPEDVVIITNLVSDDGSPQTSQ